MCPYCPNRRFYNSGGWRDHMSKKHSSVPCYGASTSEESMQAQAMLDAISTDPSAHIRSLEVGASNISSSSSQKGSTRKSNRGDEIQSMIKEIPTNMTFLQTKSRKRYGGASTSTAGSASTSQIQSEKISKMAHTVMAPLPVSPPISTQQEEELPETLPYNLVESVEDEPDISQIQQQPDDDTPQPPIPSDEMVAQVSRFAPPYCGKLLVMPGN